MSSIDVLDQIMDIYLTLRESQSIALEQPGRDRSMNQEALINWSGAPG